jgi:tRNA A-37 threonylcarbamoyl transferase component Bud32/tetratricopeptide (TPR) repeat protein
MSATDRQLLFGVLALQLELITVDQFVEACTIWASKKDRPLPDLLFDRGWLQAQDKSDIDRLMARKLRKHGGDASASLQEAARETRVRESLLSIGDDAISRTLDPTPPPHGVAVVATRAFVPDGHERYTLSRLHATGGIGRVWLAHDVTLRREVALKELRPEKTSNDALLGRFLREARVTGQLEHPGIVPIYEVGQRPDDHAPYYTMRFIRGQTMAEAADHYHKRRASGDAGPLELRKLLSAFVGVCNAIAYAHSRGVLHRDLKPQNVVLGGFGEVIVLDWGLARLLDDRDADVDSAPLDLGSTLDLEKTRDGQTLGTPSYMSPEQATARPDLLGPATDVYGLGAVLYHILTNRPPFPGPTSDEAIQRVISEPPQPPKEIVAATPGALQAICLKALSKKPQDRYPSATELADEVQHWLADEPVKAHAEPLYVKAGRWMRHRRAFVAAASVFLICATVGLAGMSAMLYREQQAAKREQEATERERQTSERHAGQMIAFLNDVTEFADRSVLAPKDSPFREKQLDRCHELMTSMLHERPDDPKVQAMLAMVKLYRATALRIAQKYTAAEQSLKESAAIFEGLVANHPNESDHAAALTQVLFYLGSLQKEMGRRREGLANLDRAFRLCEGPAAAGDKTAKFNLAVTTNELSILQFGMESMETTEATALKAVARLREIAETGSLPKTVVPRLFLSAALARVANCRREMNRVSEGLPLVEDAGKIMQTVEVDYGASNDVRHFRTIQLSSKALALAATQDRRSDALSFFDQTIRIWKDMGRGRNDRQNITFASDLTRRAEYLRQEKRFPAAEADLQEAEALLKAIPPSAEKTVDCHLAAARIAAGWARLATDRKDKDAAAKTKAARDAYLELLKHDPDNTLERKELEKLNASVAGK